jgi:hypothetical protein
MRERIPIQTATAFAGVTFLVVGVLGFVPGITTHYGEMSFAGHDSGAKLLNLFQVSILLNIVHLLFGVVGLVLARTAERARNFLTGGGVAYLALWVLGVVGAGAWVPVNTADNWLHFALGIGMLGLGFIAGRGPVAAAPGSI